MDGLIASHYVRFFGGSVICSGINNIILIVGDYFGLGYVILTIVCYLCSGTVGYVFHSRITFRNQMTLKGYLNFTLGIWFGLPVAIIILAVLTGGLSLAMWIAAPTMTVLMFGYHYLIARLTITQRLVRLSGSLASIDANTG